MALASFRRLRDAGVTPSSAFVIFDLSTVETFDDDIADLHRMAVGVQATLHAGPSTKVAIVSEPGAGEHFAKLYRDVRDTLTPTQPALLPDLHKLHVHGRCAGLGGRSRVMAGDRANRRG